MPEFHAEPYLHLAGLTHKSALIAWGAFYFRIKEREGDFKLVDDSSLKKVHPPRKQTIGSSSEPYDDQARVEISDRDGHTFSVTANNKNYCWVTGLEPNTEYSYRVIVNDEEWASGERKDWVNKDGKKGLLPGGRRYLNEFRTFPDPSEDPESLSFAVLGDYGRGVKEESDNDRRQLEIADALEKAVGQEAIRLILTTGDNIYATRKLGIFTSDSGDEDDDWFFTFYQPYRYIINRIPVYPCIGNHDTQETEAQDDRDQLYDNLYIRERIAADEPTDRASLDPGLFYRFRFGSNIEFCCLDTSQAAFSTDRLYMHPRHRRFLELAFPDGNDVRWRIPFGHHPRFCAGPTHPNTKTMEFLTPFFKRSGVRVALSGHEHNFQHSEEDGIHYVISGAAGKRTAGPPKKFEDARTISWSTDSHFLLVKITGEGMVITPRGECDADGRPTVIACFDPQQNAFESSITVKHSRSARV